MQSPKNFESLSTSVDVKYQDVNAHRNEGKTAHRKKIAYSVLSRGLILVGF